MKNKLPTSSNLSVKSGLRIRITGIVQGVGFRPFVFNLAERYGLTGWVRNTSAGVEIEVDGDAQELDGFLDALQAETPPLARIDGLSVQHANPQGFETFEIITSQGEDGESQPISPDYSICPDCLHELFDANDHRYRYPFINCTNCGPRFTIIQDIPYDRPKTTMASFAMCTRCASEYHDPRNRRFHAQPVACPDCGPQIWLETNPQQDSTTPLTGDAAVKVARDLLRQGKILAIKGLGGFHLACDATNHQAVSELRRRKLRRDKAFALMMPNLKAIEHHCYVGSTSRKLLESHERPIVILEKRPASTISSEVAPGLTNLGVMLPYTPLHYLLLEPVHDFPDALVMTSGNLSEEPIVTDNQQAREQLAGLADAYLMHDRQIHIRCDDSVYQTFQHAPYPLRRSRGYAPNPLTLAWSMPMILAGGAELKNTFCLTRQSYAYVSHHIGDLENFETLQSFTSGISHYEQLFRIQPELLVYDLHPDYLSTRYIKERAASQGLPSLGVQHHHAHIAAVMAEHNLPASETVIGVALDGTGYGVDGTIWGGEVLVARYTGFERAFALRSVPLPGGDKAVRNPWRMALAWLDSSGIAWDEDLPPVRFANQTPAPGDLPALNILANQLKARINAPLTSSMGRLFDAAAALIGIRQQVNYEAQAAIEMESIVAPNEFGIYPIEITNGLIDPAPMWQAMIKDLRKHIPPAIIAARFHNSIVMAIHNACRLIRQQDGIRQVALSGGVWQNKTLLGRCVNSLRNDKFDVLIHQQLPANDGGLSLGQAVIAYHHQNETGLQ